MYDSQFGWMWHEVALKLIHVTDDAAWHRKVSKYICNFLTQNKTSFGSDYLGIVTSKLFEKAPVETWSVFGEVLTAGTDFEKYVLSEFLGKSGNMFDNTTSPLWTLPRDQFRAWVQAHRDIVPLILGTISLYTVEKQPDSQEVFKWHPHALVLLEEGTDEQKLERSLIGNLLSFGSTGSRVPYLEKRIVLVHDLSAIGDAKLARIARPLEDWLAEEVEQTKRKELNQQACFQ